MRNSPYSVRQIGFGNYLVGKSRSKKSEAEQAATEMLNNVLMGSDSHPPSSYQKDNNGIEVDENKIYFYAEVGEKEALDLNKIIRHLDIEMQYLKQRLCLQENPPIRLYIHSPGGSFFSALSIIDAIKSCVSPVYTYIDGHAASAATMISVVGKRRFATRNSFMLIHQQRMAWEGKHADFIDEIENQKHVTETMKRVYLEHTKMSEPELASILKRELHIPSEECLKLGLIDEIV